MDESTGRVKFGRLIAVTVGVGRGDGWESKGEEQFPFGQVAGVADRKIKGKSHSRRKGQSNFRLV